MARYTDQTRNQADTLTIRVLLVAGGLSLILAVIAIFAGTFVRRSIVTPIGKLSDGANAVAGGNPNSIGILALTAALPTLVVLESAGQTAARELTEAA